MAKQISLVELQGTFGNITFVNSPTYGNHVRAKRGTYKKARMNAACKKQSKVLVAANVPAKIFRDAILSYHKEVYDGKLWGRLRSMFGQQIKNYGGIDFSKLAPFEIHPDYPLSQLLPLNVKIQKENGVLDVQLSYDKHPEFSNVKGVDGYLLTAVAVFPDLKKKTATTVAARSAVIDLNGKVVPLNMKLQIPTRAKTYIVCMKIDGCTRGEAKIDLAAQGMRVVESGVI